MATNHMWLECTVCGERHVIAKTFGAQWQARAYADGEIRPDMLTEQLDRFFEDHMHGAEMATTEGTHFRLAFDHLPEFASHASHNFDATDICLACGLHRRSPFTDGECTGFVEKKVPAI